MLISIIIPTLGARVAEITRLFNSLREQTYKKFEVIVISQGNHEDIEQILKRFIFPHIHIKSDAIGLSKGRNLALAHCKGTVITFSDDDCWYPEDAFKSVVEKFENKVMDYDAYCMRIYDPIEGKPYKNYPLRQVNIGLFDVGRCSSIEIFYKRNNKSSTVSFDEDFGLGAKYPSAEENIFLADLIKNGCRVIYFPQEVVYHRVKEYKKTRFSGIKMRTSYYMFKRIFGKWRGATIYYAFCIKHFFKIDNKFAAIFQVW